MFEFDAITKPDEEFQKACAGYCRLAMERVGVSKDACDCILDSLWDTFTTVSIEAARADWEKK